MQSSPAENDLSSTRGQQKSSHSAAVISLDTCKLNARVHLLALRDTATTYCDFCEQPETTQRNRLSRQKSRRSAMNKSSSSSSYTNIYKAYSDNIKAESEAQTSDYRQNCQRQQL